MGAEASREENSLPKNKKALKSVELQIRSRENTLKGKQSTNFGAAREQKP